MRRILAFTAVTGLALVASAGVAVGAGQDNANTGSGQAAGHSQAPANSQAGTHSQAQGQANGQTQSPQTQSGSGGAQRQANTQSDGRGANQTGPYDPSGVGLPSGNGKSTSNNGKRPCAGCVGSADTKNPPGQLPGGQDANKGYECDENQGVGKTNPAHSGCSSTSNPPTKENPPTDRTPPKGKKTPTHKQGSQHGSVPQSRVLGEQRTPESPDQGAQSPDERETGESPEERASRGVSGQKAARELAFTGLGLLFMALLGAAMTAIGGALRKTTEEAELPPAVDEELWVAPWKRMPGQDRVPVGAGDPGLD